MTTYPDGASLLAVAPTRLEEEVIFAQGLEMFGWHVRSRTALIGLSIYGLTCDSPTALRRSRFNILQAASSVLGTRSGEVSSCCARLAFTVLCASCRQHKVN